MTQPNTPADAIRQAAARHKASTDAIREVARELAEEREMRAEEAAAANKEAQP